MNRRIVNLEAHRDQMDQAFPNGDMKGHCEYHKLIIENTLQKKRLTAAIKEKTIVGCVWMLLIFIGTLLIHGLHDAAYAWLHDKGFK